MDTRRERTRPLHRQLALSFTSVVSALAVLLGGSFGVVTAVSLRERATRRAAEAAEALAAAVEEAATVDSLAVLRTRSQSAVAALDAIAARAPDRAAAQREAIDLLSSLRSGDEGYFFVIDESGRLVFHPFSELVGTDVADREPFATILRDRAGYVRYAWRNPGEREAREKSAYALPYRPWGWFIAASDYATGFVDALPAEAVDAILEGVESQAILAAAIVRPDGSLFRASRGWAGLDALIRADGDWNRRPNRVIEWRVARTLRILALAPLRVGDLRAAIVLDGDDYETLVGDYVLFVLVSVTLACATVAFLSRRMARAVIDPVTRFAERLSARLEGPSTELDRVDDLGSLLRRQMRVLVKLDYERRNRRVAESRLLVSETVFTSTCEGICVTDGEGTILRVNPAFTTVTGYSEDEALGGNPRILKSTRHPPEFYAEMWRSLAESGRWSGEIWNRRKDGTEYPELLSIVGVSDPESGEPRYVAVFHDLTELNDVQDHARYLATHDTLTGLPNRTLLEQVLEERVSAAERSEGELALLFVDLDSFREVNESFGHAAGDQLLLWLARRLEYAFRGADHVARFGADRFVVLVSVTPELPQLGSLATRIIELARGPVELAGKSFEPSVSVGIAVYPDEADSSASLLRNADAALGEAKRSGRGEYRFYDRDANRAAHQRLATQEEIRRALERDELFLLYQPIVEIDTRRVAGVEALVRWNRNGSVATPGEFLAALERSNVMPDLGRWVMRTAIAAIADMPPGTYVSVNASAQELTQEGFAEYVIDLLARSCCEPVRLCVEVTEQAAIYNLRRARAALAALKEAGVRLALDDFGEGYASFGYLRDFGLDVAKLDRSFIAKAPEDPQATSIVSGFVSMISGLGLRAVIEGVETAEQFAYLASLGSLYGQGYHFSPPVRLERIRWNGSVESLDYNS